MSIKKHNLYFLTRARCVNQIRRKRCAVLECLLIFAGYLRVSFSRYRPGTDFNAIPRALQSFRYPTWHLRAFLSSREIDAYTSSWTATGKLERDFATFVRSLAKLRAKFGAGVSGASRISHSSLGVVPLGYELFFPPRRALERTGLVSLYLERGQYTREANVKLRCIRAVMSLRCVDLLNLSISVFHVLFNIDHI